MHEIVVTKSGAVYYNSGSCSRLVAETMPMYTPTVIRAYCMQRISGYRPDAKIYGIKTR